MIRAVEMGVEVLKERNLTRRVGIELSQNSQICDRMVGEPTVDWQGFYDAFRAASKETVDAAPLLPVADDQNSARDRTHAPCQRARRARNGARPRQYPAWDERKRSRGHDRRPYPPRWSRLQRESRNGARFHSALVRARHRHLHRH